MFNLQDQTKFWRLLTDYEELTRREAVAVRHQDYPSLVEAQRLKGAIFPVWHQLGADLRIGRHNCPELRTRLDAISNAESANLQALETQRAAVQQRVGELAVTRQRLRTVGKNYHGGQPAQASTGSFTACG